MKKLFILPMMLVSTVSFAKTYVCTFTEPFVTVKYYETHDILTMKAVGQGLKIKGQVEMLKMDGGKQIEILDGQANSILSMKLTGKGTDGMSDLNYSYEATLNLNGHSVQGGCNVKKGLLSRKDVSQSELERDSHVADDTFDRDFEVGTRIED